MIPSWRALSRVALVVGLCAWVLSTVASGLHHLVVEHVVCADHGELVELDGHHESVAAAADQVEISAIPVADHHDHGCSDLLADRTGLASAPPALGGALRLKRSTVPMTGAQAPRGPPLAYAPKTSPPSLS